MCVYVCVCVWVLHAAAVRRKIQQVAANMSVGRSGRDYHTVASNRWRPTARPSAHAKTPRRYAYTGETWRHTSAPTTTTTTTNSITTDSRACLLYTTRARRKTRIIRVNTRTRHTTAGRTRIWSNALPFVRDTLLLVSGSNYESAVSVSLVRLRFSLNSVLFRFI